MHHLIWLLALSIDYELYQREYSQISHRIQTQKFLGKFIIPLRREDSNNFYRWIFERLGGLFGRAYRADGRTDGRGVAVRRRSARCRRQNGRAARRAFVIQTVVRTVRRVGVMSDERVRVRRWDALAGRLLLLGRRRCAAFPVVMPQIFRLQRLGERQFFRMTDACVQ